MKRTVLSAGAIVVASTLMASAAQATVTNTASGPVSSDPGQANSIVVDNFNGVIAPGATLDAYSLPPVSACTPGATGCNAQFVTSAEDAAVPAGTPAGQQSLSVSEGNGVGFAVLNFAKLGLDSVSFYWGSIDNWNTVQLLTPDGNLVETGGVQDPGSIVTGASLITQTCTNEPGGPGVTCGDGYFNHAGSQRVTFSWNPAVDDVGEIQFIDSPYPAFELANVTGTQVSAAPEPSTWALMLAGLGGVGLMLRRARKTAGLRFKDAFAA